MEGPRHPQLSEIPSLSELLDRTFRAQRFDKGERDIMLTEYAQLVNGDNLDHLWVFVDGGHVVSHVGVYPRWMIIEGCRVDTASIGAVATSTEYRGRGLASRLMDSAIRQSVDEGRPLMPISGSRGLYKRIGAADCVKTVTYSINPCDAARLADPDLVVRDASPGDVPAMADLYRRHPVRNGRYLEDYRRALQIQFGMNKPSVFKMIYRRGSDKPCAYMIAQREEAGSFLARIGETAGDPWAILGAIQALVESDTPAAGQADALVLDVMPSDVPMHGILETAGLKGTPAVQGTVLVTDPPRLVRDIEAYQAERLGPRTRLEVRVEKGMATFSVGKAAWSCPAENVSRVLLGSLGNPASLPEAGPVADVLRQITPIPIAPYGLSHV